MKPKDQIKSTSASKKKNAEFVVAHGRRKEAAARVRLFKGKGQMIVNEKPIEQYFPGEIAKIKWQRPFVLTKSDGAYFATIKVEGSGKNGQLEAVIHGLSRALILANSDFRPILKKAHLLTRDSRVKERRKYGLAQKARKGKQSPKR
ncbi:MAG: 30S ribosomal protein S9 [Candidatus Curtissbacteria bacterium GW2011_GWA1_40_47]|nr:MAG: 30S ribosomal protein S9 [Candidatus Curtissbacteria bacterium GW2011_GWB1_40_28]KKR61238.1 MAG: 30S ribosomal protein S9 [Candidatus Curtissbacteria bacterium GW2011_GWA2_40_31]KKR62177.1 MAG: 30S ribosomal protein S9 [Microgenomates group bacterium GW2011_GWC1_40_35]KKR66196.1 MAG: 30S ribosomal protein S9 [Candidatus Curtissbacteria bacterium GW2011_GWA1_40_47]KKS02343.1 MAG: 30S ribosomal protein S9 [Candidatus Curtissbacteria bacterium GW2011_GWC2_41_21]